MGPLKSPPAAFHRKHIGRYEIIYPISQGGMASVYACRLNGLAGFQRLMAIKIIHPHLAAESQFIEMFLDEARLAAGIHHPNVGEVIEVAEDGGIYYMVCELILGQSLRTFAERAQSRKMAISAVLYARIASMVAQALHAAHELTNPMGEPLEIVHRDVSPRNILLSYNGFVKLIDFGVAYARDRISHTASGTLKGKVAYMSPEQVQTFPVDRRSDIFSLGVVLYEMVTGCIPFDGHNDVERINKITAYQLTPPCQINADIPKPLESIILRAMAYLPEDRYATAAALSNDLEMFISKSADQVDSEALSQLMHTLFAREREEHLASLRGSGADETVLQSEVHSEDVTKQMPVRPLGDVDTEVTVAGQADNEHHSHHPKPKRRTVARIAGLVAVPVALLAIVFVIFFAQVFAQVKDPNRIDSVDFDAGNDHSSIDVEEAKKRNAKSDGDKSPLPDVVISLSIALSASPRVSQQDVQVWLDDVAAAPGARTFLLAADSRMHQLRVAADGYVDYQAEFTASISQEIEIVLEPIRQSPSRLTKGRSSDVGTAGAKSGKECVSPATKSQGGKECAPSSLLEKSPYQ